MASAKHIQHPSVLSPRIHLIISIVGFVIAAGAFSAYCLYAFHPQLITQVDPLPSPLVSGEKTPATDTSAATTTTPSSSTPPITPTTSSEVPSLTPTVAQPTQTMSYQSTNWAGYLATGGNFTSVTGTWVIPTPSPTSTSVESGDGTWIGIGGVTTKDLIQIGTENTISPSGIISTSGFYELLPAGAIGTPSLVMRPGDTISASITQTTTDLWTIAMTNVTTGRTFSTSVNYSSSFSSAEWIQEDPSYPDGSLVLLDNFGTVTFSNLTTTMNGTTLSASASGASSITLIGQGGAKGHGGTPANLSGSSFSVGYY